MSMNFRVSVLRRKVWVRPTLWGSYICLPEEYAEEIDAWVTACKLGRRVAYDRWLLNDRAAVAMFLLKWQ
jgi:hypothetical protein